MHITEPPSRFFDPARIVSPQTCGDVSWTDFNRSFHRLQNLDWWKINEGTRENAGWRIIRLILSYYLYRTDAYTCRTKKIAGFEKLRPKLPRNPDIVYFGAEAGTEALLLQQLLGNQGQVLLIDRDEGAYERFLEADHPPSFRNRVRYCRENLFEGPVEASFDIGIDWGLLEHFPGDRKKALLRRMQEFIRPGGFQISSVPKNSWGNRLFYRAFSDEVNFGYRELMSRSEFQAVVESGGNLVLDHWEMIDSHVILSQKPLPR
jgi:hypothetical protein